MKIQMHTQIREFLQVFHERQLSRFVKLWLKNHSQFHSCNGDLKLSVGWGTFRFLGTSQSTMTHFHGI